MVGDTYRVRPYRPGDCAGFLSLYETVWGHRKGSDWFDWRFRANPYGDGVQMVVAESDDGIVGVEPLLPFPLRVGDRRLDAYQPVDWLVHPDHRRCGLFTRMTERLLDRYADDADLMFNFPTDALLPGLESFDWRVVGDLSTSYRVQNPRPLVTDAVGPTAGRALAPAIWVAAAATKRAHALLDRCNAPSTDSTVEAHDRLPAETVERLYATTAPAAIHVPRDAAYLHWRFDNPNWATTTYVATADGDPVGSLVAATERHQGCTTAIILDAQPMHEAADRSAVIEPLLARFVRDNRDADVLKAPGWYAPRLRRRYGFWHDSALSVSHLPTVSRATVRPLTDDLDDAAAWQIDGHSLTDRANWRLTLGDLDIE